MFSLQQLFGKGDKFFGLLEASAEEAQQSAKLLTQLLQSPPGQQKLDDFVLTRRKDKRITEEIREQLVSTFVTGLEREDIEALSNALYKIPKTVEKFAERYNVSTHQLPPGATFHQQSAMLEQATSIVLAMVKQLRDIQHLEKMKVLNDKLQYIEGEADKLMVDLLRELYSGKFGPIQVIVLKDLYDLLEKVIDRCRDAGNVVSHIVLKNS